MKVLHAVVYGYVQGIGYRKFIKDQARKRGLVGWVRNLPEGTVEFEVSGDEDRIQDLVDVAKRGPFLAQIKTIDTSWEEKDFPCFEFKVRHDVD